MVRIVAYIYINIHDNRLEMQCIPRNLRKMTLKSDSMYGNSQRVPVPGQADAGCQQNKKQDSGNMP